MRAWVAAGLVLWAVAAFAEPYVRCTKPDGSVEYMRLAPGATCSGKFEIRDIDTGNKPFPSRPSSLRGQRGIWPESRLGDITVGMAADQVRDLWGEPDSINVTQSAAGQSEQWVYKYGAHQHLMDFVYLSGGRVRVIQLQR